MRIVDYLYGRYLNYRYYLDNKKKNVIFEKNSYVSMDCIFEGNNYIAGELYQCQIGYGSYVHKNSELKCVKVGRFCAIAENVNIRLFQHPTAKVSVSPCFQILLFSLPSINLLINDIKLSVMPCQWSYNILAYKPYCKSNIHYSASE